MKTLLPHQPFEQTRSLAESKAIVQSDFDKWYCSGTGFLKGVRFYIKEKDLKLPGFMLHQAAEWFYKTVIMVFTGYRPNTHSLHELRRYASRFSPELLSVFPFPTKSKREIYLFDLLTKGYMDVKNDDGYQIAEEELHELRERVEKMSLLIKGICELEINSFDAP